MERKDSALRFTKMEGIGNDYVYINCFQESVADAPALARQVSDRHFGVGSDGLILIKPCREADFEMEMYNADGSMSGMCGNGIRCVGKYVYDYGLTDRTELKILTGSGIRQLRLIVEDGKVDRVRVDMGRPVFEASKVPVRSALPEVINSPLLIGGKTWKATCVSMGNPHCVVPVEEVDGFDLERIGPLFEQDESFPERVNAEFIQVISRSEVRMRVWERGTGETMACGTGACAAAAACIRCGWTQETVTVRLPGGDLEIFWDREADTIYMTGPARRVFDGQL